MDKVSCHRRTHIAMTWSSFEYIKDAELDITMPIGGIWSSTVTLHAKSSGYGYDWY